MNSPKWENTFKMNTICKNFSPKWESALPFGRKSPQVERAPLLIMTFMSFMTPKKSENNLCFAQFAEHWPLMKSYVKPAWV